MAAIRPRNCPPENNSVETIHLRGHESDVPGRACVIVTRRNGKRILNSMQAIVIEANGWKFRPTMNIDDIDAQEGSGLGTFDGWKEAVSVFGMSEGNYVYPTMKLYDGTVLCLTDYVVSGRVMRDIGFSGKAKPHGTEYAASDLVDCPFGRDDQEAERCRLTVSFDTDIDTIIILSGLTQQSKTNLRAAVFLSELVMPRGCQCSQVDIGPQMVTAPVPNVVNECLRRESTALRTQCDFLGNRWCSKKDRTKLVLTGASLPNGNFPCKKSADYKVELIGRFIPEEAFDELE